MDEEKENSWLVKEYLDVKNVKSESFLTKLTCFIYPLCRFL